MSLFIGLVLAVALLLTACACGDAPLLKIQSRSYSAATASKTVGVRIHQAKLNHKAAAALSRHASEGIGDMAKTVDCPTPLFSSCIPIYNAAMAQGWAAADTASVHEVLGSMAGIAAAKKTR